MLKKYKDLPNSVKASIWFTFCSVLQKGITFITVPIFTRLMTTTEYGQLSIFLSWQEIISIFATLNLHYQVFNNGMVKFDKDKDGYTTSMVGLSFISCCVVFLIISLLFNFWNKITNIDFFSTVLMFINMFSLSVIGLWTVRKRYEFDYKLLVVFTVLMALLNPILGIVLVKLASKKVMFRIISISITAFLFGIIAFILLLKKSKEIFNLEYYKYALKIDLPLIPHYISSVILHSTDRIMIGRIVNEASAALYSVSYNVALVMQIVINSINASFIPWVYQKMKDKDYETIRKKSNVLLIFVGLVSLVPMFFSPEAIMFLGGEKYMPAIDIIPILSSSVFMIYLYSVFIIVEMYYEKSNYITMASIVAGLLNIILNLIFVKMFGYKAAAYTTLVSYCVLSFVHGFMYKRICQKNNISQNIFDIKYMLFVAMAVVCVSIMVAFIYDYAILRYLLLLVIVLFIFLNRKQILLRKS